MPEKITQVRARQVLDSRGNPTVEAEVFTSSGFSRAIVPSGASTGSYEAHELRDGGKSFLGKSVLKAVENVNKKIAPKLIGHSVEEIENLDKLMIELDGTPHKEKLGANAILSVSMAACKEAARRQNTPLYSFLAKLAGRKGTTLPIPQMNVINGGRHAGLENSIQEHMHYPHKAKSFAEALQFCSETYHSLKIILKKAMGPRAILLGDEGGFVPRLKTVKERLDVMMDALEVAGHKDKMALALDSAASEFYVDGVYDLGEKKLSSGEMVDFYSSLAKDYPIVSIEDGLAEDDWDGWSELTKKLGSKIQIVGDDLLVTNTERIEKALRLKACNALLLKVNQIGSVSEAVKAANLAFKNGWKVVVSHRSGETENSFIADLSVALDAGQSKFGAPARSERTAKYNQLLRIEEALGSKAGFG
jgi:enolase